jgi:hypothetical protein
MYGLLTVCIPTGFVVAHLKDFPLFKEQINTTCFCVMDLTHKNARQHPVSITKGMLIYQYIRKSEHSLVS